MIKEYHVRYNKRHGQPGWGSNEHVWRIIGPDDHDVVKEVIINVPCRGMKTGMDYSMVCHCVLSFDENDSSIAYIN